jgi:imidazolonepropionase-like amidohydrolase
MRFIVSAFLIALAALLMPRAITAAPPPASAYAFTNVTVVPMDRNRLIPNQTVIVRGGRIVAMGPARRTPVPRGATIIQGRGRYLMPGLAEMHAHVPPNNNPQEIEDVLFLYAANGVTFARSMLGAPHHLELRAKAARGEILSPRIYTSGPSLNGNSVKSPEDGRRMVAEQKKAGYDFLKIHPGLDRPRYDAIAETARRLGLPMGGHVPDAVGLARALEVRQATVDHLDGYMSLLVRDGTPANAAPGFFGLDLTDVADERKIAQVVASTRAAGTWNVPTQSLIEHVLLPEPNAAELIRRPEMLYVAPRLRDQWVKAKGDLQGQPGYTPERARRYVDFRRKLIKALHQGGAGLLLGSDAPQWFNVPGFALHHELRMLVTAGLTPFDALSTGTRNVAKFLGEEGAFGTVAAGKRADLILVDANPLADVGNVQRRAGVMLNGRWLPQSEIQAGLAAIARRHAQ